MNLKFKRKVAMLRRRWKVIYMEGLARDYRKRFYEDMEREILYGYTPPPWRDASGDDIDKEK